MTTIPISHGLIFAGALFALGLAGVILRRNLLFMLLSIEIMLNAAGVAFIVAGSHHGAVDGQVAFFFILAIAAAEVAVGLALLLQIYHRFRTLDTDAVSRMKG